MGTETRCRVEIDDQSSEAKVLLETDELILRGAVKARIAFRDAANVAADGGVLRLEWAQDGTTRAVRLHVGADAAKWAEKIRNPKTVAEKLGVKPGQKIAIVGALDTGFLGSLPYTTKVGSGSDVIFFAANARQELTKLVALRKALAPAGAVWVIRPKGVASISESDVMSAAKSAGLVDVKVVRFSDTHTAEKLVIPVAARP
ncbi:MAG: DUF3052 domain-containing protein [Acidobacteriota bacterium]|nr:DUF3052 domain-containing protein [Acidobacteriota bacterium]